MERVSGEGQAGLPGRALPYPVVVRVVDSLGVAIRGGTVRFAVTGGGGSISPAADTTGVYGQVSATWTVGSEGLNTLLAEVPGAGVSATFSATATLTPFVITTRNIGPFLAVHVQAALDAAVALWQRAIVGDLHDLYVEARSGELCGGRSPAIGEIVDDVMIYVVVERIDGFGGIVASAGPCAIRVPSGLTVVGLMRFDSADVAAMPGSLLEQVFLHEMGHVLGFGTLWDLPQFNCLRLPSLPGQPQDTHFACPRARAAFDSIGGTTYTGGFRVPVENCAGLQGCGAGTINGHWRELVFGTELMTGVLDAGSDNPLSVVSVASMADLGYVVDYRAAQPYTQAFRAPRVGRDALRLLEDTERFSIHAYDERRQRPVGVIRP